MANSMMNSENTVKKIYQTVIDEVLTNIREAFLDEGYDEQLLQELKQMWESKLNASRAIQSNDDTSQETSTTTTSSSSGGTATTTSSLRLPVTQPSSKELAQSMIARNINNLTNVAAATAAAASANNNSAMMSGQSSSAHSGRSQINLDVKTGILPSMDAATRAAINALPTMYSSQQQHAAAQEKQKKQHQIGAQLDGGVDGSSSDDEDDELVAGSVHGDEEDDDKTNNDDPSEYEGKEDPEPLNSEDDLTEPGTPDSNLDLFDTENVIVCQYDKITRIKNKWKFHLKDGIMNINGKDYLFSKANGDAEW